MPPGRNLPVTHGRICPARLFLMTGGKLAPALRRVRPEMSSLLWGETAGMLKSRLNTMIKVHDQRSAAQPVLRLVPADSARYPASFHHFHHYTGEELSCR